MLYNVTIFTSKEHTEITVLEDSGGIDFIFSQ